MVKGLDNPASEIQRVQMLMKISDSRRPLGEIFGWWWILFDIVELCCLRKL